jgi:hypothetical protein
MGGGSMASGGFMGGQTTPDSSKSLTNQGPTGYGGSQSSGGFMGGQSYSAPGYRPREQMQYAPGYAPWEQPQAQNSQPFMPGNMSANPMVQQGMNALATNQDGSVDINAYGNMWQGMGGADLSGQAQQDQQVQQGLQNQPQTDPANQGKVGGGSFFDFSPVKSPTYLPQQTANFLGIKTGGAPTDNRMMWNMGNAGGTPGWQLVNGYNGYKG